MSGQTMSTDGTLLDLRQHRMALHAIIDESRGTIALAHGDIQHSVHFHFGLLGVTSEIEDAKK